MAHTRNGQRGVSLSGLVMALFVIIIVVALGLKMLPGYMEYYKAKNAIDAIAGDRSKTSTVTEVRKAFDARATIDDISAVKGSDLEVTKEGNTVVISFSYRREIPLFFNVGLYVDFSGSSNR